MSFFNTGNPVPSNDPRDLDDNAMHIDEIVNSTFPTFVDRLGTEKKTLVGIQEDVNAIISPNVLSLSGLVLSSNTGLYATGVGTLALFDLTPLARTFSAAADAAAQSAALSWAAKLASPTFTGTPAAPTPAVGTNTTQLATSKMVQDEIAFNRPWLDYTPTLTSRTGAFTSANSIGAFMIAFGVCHWRARIIITTVGTGTYARITLPVPARSGWDAHTFLARNSSSGQNGSAVTLGSLDKVECSSNSGDLVASDGSVIYINGSYPVA